MSVNRPLDERERKRFTYFSSLSPMARKIMQDKEKIREKYGPEWARLPPAQQDEIIDRCLSQMEFSIASLSIQEPSNGMATSEPRPLPKASQGSRSSSLDALGPARKEEEASFWKINAERSREGPEAEFQSLTPSQIKSMEKGEKVLPTCYRQDPSPKDREVTALRPEQRVLPSASTERERPQPVQGLTSTLPEVTPCEPPGKLLSPDSGQEDEDDALFLEPKSAQVSSSNVVLKTGFDFLDNW
ncbi:hypothetical protein GW7_00817 [Heterocephalus glaber]|uniref:DUF4706 domain-containing protein n=1 Tax=Heterocephalus glaber TaxID=10181 RepID=G5BQI7_HETGA|nr:hypothetical protein GW7_00817 [Heterocephalus glaber]